MHSIYDTINLIKLFLLILQKSKDNNINIKLVVWLWENPIITSVNVPSVYVNINLNSLKSLLKINCGQQNISVLIKQYKMIQIISDKSNHLH